MVSRQETARPLLTPGEVMQLPPSDELVLVSGLAPIRAKKLRYYRDRNFTSRVAPPPVLCTETYQDKPKRRFDDWNGQVRDVHPRLLEVADNVTALADTTDQGGHRKQQAPELGASALGSMLKSETDTPDGETSNRQSDAIRRAYAMNNTKRHTAPEQEMLPYFGDDQ
jgi:type IV secretion system protein VirD4